MRKPKPFEIGKRYGHWTLLKEVPSTTRRKALLRCDCGQEKIRQMNHILNGSSTSCGCLQYHKQGTHRATYSVLYNRWKGMKRRCFNENTVAFPRYGGRGISICESWLDFTNFETWALDNGFEENLTLERKDNDGNYEPSNCCWASRSIQSQNRNKVKSTKYKYIGVDQLPSGNFRAQLMCKGVRVKLGTYLTEKEAVIARNEYILTNKLNHKLNSITDT